MYAGIFSLLLIPTPERIWTDPVENKQTKPVQTIQWNLPICVYKYIHTNTHTLNLKHWKIYWSSFKKYQHSGFRKGEKYKICSFFHMYPTVDYNQLLLDINCKASKAANIFSPDLSKSNYVKNIGVVMHFDCTFMTISSGNLIFRILSPHTA